MVYNRQYNLFCWWWRRRQLVAQIFCGIMRERSDSAKSTKFRNSGKPKRKIQYYCRIHLWLYTHFREYSFICVYIERRTRYLIWLTPPARRLYFFLMFCRKFSKNRDFFATLKMSISSFALLKIFVFFVRESHFSVLAARPPVVQFLGKEFEERGLSLSHLWATNSNFLFKWKARNGFSWLHPEDCRIYFQFDGKQISLW